MSVEPIETVELKDHLPVLLEYGEALSCPFCGERPTIEPSHGGGPHKRLVSCSDVHCQVSPAVTGSTRQRAIDAWNSRGGRDE